MLTLTGRTTSRTLGSKAMHQYYEFERPRGRYMYEWKNPLPHEQYDHPNLTVHAGINGLPGWQTTIAAHETTEYHFLTCTVRGPPSREKDNQKLRRLVERIYWPGILLELDTRNPRVWDNDWTHNTKRYRNNFAPTGHWNRQHTHDENTFSAATQTWIAPHPSSNANPLQHPETTLAQHLRGDTSYLDRFLQDLPPILNNVTVYAHQETPFELRQVDLRFDRPERNRLPKGTISRVRARPFRCLVPAALQHLLS